jgi:RNA polymerase sigma-70 factor (ECF subfamily)
MGQKMKSSPKPKTSKTPSKAMQKTAFLRRASDKITSKSKNAEPGCVVFPEELKQFRRASDLARCSQLSDSDLIGVIHTQNKDAYRELFSRYQKKLYAYISHLVGSREESEDILQNVFVKTYKNIEHFDRERKFSSWIYRIAHNEAVNYLKRKSKRYMVSWEDITTSKDKLDTSSSDELPEEKWMHKEITKEIDEALEKLPPKYQHVLRLRYFDEMSYEEIGVLLQKPVNTVGTLINRAKKKLLEVVKLKESKDAICKKK